ncbi:efflux RND transporter permease subunit [Woeseia oceani]|uniref:Multidrug transporter AcrB n=1 Tax=Woeseia oceani TaxID=1548547 RepID=A0A193LDE6_9GAMM|nr:efflux RND transporter permease subunit [Woeseia oceani]ANO50532.1 multidrug transporter AcrB [Woeseia oceani]
MSSNDTGSSLGATGAIARYFQNNALTPLLALAALLMGAFAVLVTPREEEPQIEVTFANVFVAFPGASSVEVENLVSIPMEQVLSEIEGVKHVYSVSTPGMGVLTVQFIVGEKRTEALVRLYNAIYSNQDWRPPNSGILPPIVKPRSIDDVPIVSATLWTEDTERATHELLQIAHALEAELKRVPGTRDVYTIGGAQDIVHVQLDPQRVAGFGLTLDDLRQALTASNTVAHAGRLVVANSNIPVQAGTFLSNRDDVAQLVVGVVDGKPVYLEDIASVTAGADQPEQYSWYATGAAVAAADRVAYAPAVTIAIAKKPGTNASDIANAVKARLAQLQATVIPDGVEVTITRNYGKTANDKATKLIQKLSFATLSVILLALVAIGWREAVVIGAAVIVTLATTLFASWAWGFTINRVSLFALIFSIGILVDDAIVVVENIHRHRGLNKGKLIDLIPPAVNEVGGPTVLATFTVIAALLPMAFVTGLMGPYMSPIPINASAGMLISLAVALVLTPWMSNKLLANAPLHIEEVGHDSRLHQFFSRLMTPFIGGDRGKRARTLLYGGLTAVIGIAMLLVALQLVVLKMLPFDNKSELQLVVDMPEGTTIETTARVLDELGSIVETLPEVIDYQAYAGTSAPINFNGLVRQYYLREGNNVGDLQINLVDKHDRDRASHDIARDLRERIRGIGAELGALTKVVEVPPGPPVLAPIVAELYGPDYSQQRDLGRRLTTLFAATDDIVDIDSTVEAHAERYVIDIDQQRAALLGVSQQQVSSAINMALSGEDVTYVHRGLEKYPIPVRLEVPVAEKSHLDSLLGLEVRSLSGQRVPIAEIASVRLVPWDSAIHHKDLLPVVYVTADMAGSLDSPLYGMFDLSGRIDKLSAEGIDIEQRYISQPPNPFYFALKWDGEWQITYETFRDMGIAYSVGMLLIYLLVVAHFRSYLLPLVIMAPIPLTIIGVMPGHALFGASFTATSMIGMIALAGIIVRNSILLVDFIMLELRAGRTLDEAVVNASAVRAKPIVLTALAAMLGAFFIVDDPIFNGLAIALIFGILISTLLTLLVIPVLFYSLRKTLVPASA